VFCIVAVSDDGPIVDAQICAVVALQLYISAPSFPTTSPCHQSVECITASHKNDVVLRQKCRNRFKAWFSSKLSQSPITTFRRKLAGGVCPPRLQTADPFLLVSLAVDLMLRDIDAMRELLYLRHPKNDSGDMPQSISWKIHFKDAFFVRCAPQ
jgi:hypothetical protein